MMDRTDRYFRRLMRLISSHTLLYTEMVTCSAILHGDRDRLLGFDPIERPLALQLGGDDPVALRECARIAEALGYDEVNLNVGCPSDRVQNGHFGACLMRTPERVGECVAAMRASVDLPVTVKHRIGVDELDRYEDMLAFVDVVASAGCDRFTVHARKAWLHGLSPKQNREVPPLRYPDVHRLARERPQLVVEINGGLRELDEVEAQLEHVDAAMLGRVAWDRPWMFVDADRRMFDDAHELPSRRDVVEAYLPELERWLAKAGPSPTALLRNLLNLYVGRPGTRRWKQALAQQCRSPTSLGELAMLAAELDAIQVPPRNSVSGNEEPSATDREPE
ncbi:tRNA dihydrouridine(20/20a) synthase DusA [Nannocystaceae bacterium ST9]